MCHEKTSLWQGIFVGASGGAMVWLLNITREEYFKYRDKKRVYDFLINQGKKTPPAPDWRTTRVIASFTNLPEDRVRYICSIHEKIARNALDNEVWGLREDN
jgi:hypothetical protein